MICVRLCYVLPLFCHVLQCFEKPDIQVSAELFSEEMNVEDFQSGIRRLRGEAKAKDAVIEKGWSLVMSPFFTSPNH